MNDALANWQWLVTPPQRDRALVLGAPDDATAACVGRGFGRVVTSLDDAERGELFDCVVVFCEPTTRERGRRTGARHSLAGLRTLIAPDGVIAVFEQHPESRLALARFLPRAASELKRAEFADLRSYYVHRGPEDPRHFVPIGRRELDAWDRANEASNWRSRTRRLLYHLGLHALFFRHRLVVARA